MLVLWPQPDRRQSSGDGTARHDDHSVALRSQAADVGRESIQLVSVDHAIRGDRRRADLGNDQTHESSSYSNEKVPITHHISVAEPSVAQCLVDAEPLEFLSGVLQCTDVAQVRQRHGPFGRSTDHSIRSVVFPDDVETGGLRTMDHEAVVV